MKIIHKNIVAALSLLFFCCVSEPEKETSVAVIDGWFDSEGYPIVSFTSSLLPLETEQSVATHVINWGKVTVSDGKDTITLTGGPDKTYFPPFKYFTYRMKGSPGTTYHLTAEYENLYAEATCTMPYPTPVDSIEIKPIEGNDTLRSATLHFTSPPDTPAYYYLTIRKRGEGTRAWPAMMGIAEATEPGIQMKIPVFHAKNQTDTAVFVPQLKVGEELEINLCRVTEEVYRFWDAYNSAIIFGGSQFLTRPTSNREGNIKGGMGVWSVQGTTRSYITVE